MVRLPVPIWSYLSHLMFIIIYRYLIYASKYIHTGYRPINEDYKVCLNSLFQWHNEYINIWTHLIPCICFALVLVKTLLSLQWAACTLDDVFFCMLVISVMYAYLSSAAFHTFMCHSLKVSTLFYPSFTLSPNTHTVDRSLTSRSVVT